MCLKRVLADFIRLAALAALVFPACAFAVDQQPGSSVVTDFATANTTALRADETRNREILARIPVGRWGQPEDIGGAAVFLAAPASDCVHGAIIPADGGWLAR